MTRFVFIQAVVQFGVVLLILRKAIGKKVSWLRLSTISLAATAGFFAVHWLFHGWPGAIAQWVRNQDVKIWHALGFGRKPPCANTYRKLLARLPAEGPLAA